MIAIFIDIEIEESIRDFVCDTITSYLPHYRELENHEEYDNDSFVFCNTYSEALLMKEHFKCILLRIKGNVPIIRRGANYEIEYEDGNFDMLHMELESFLIGFEIL